MAHTTDGFISECLKTHLGQHFFEAFGKRLEPLLEGGIILLIWWLVCLWLHRRRVFLRI